MIVLVWLIFAVLVGAIAAAKERSFLAFTFVSLVLSPILGLICLLITKPSGMKKCPSCAESVKGEALKCKHCGTALAPATISSSVEA